MKKLLTVMLLALLLLTGCKGFSSAKVIEATDGFGYGKQGDIIRTAFFDLTVNSTKKVKEYGSIQAKEGMTLLVVEITVKENQNKKIEMFDTDFQLQFGQGEKEFTYSVTAFEDGLEPEGKMLESIYVLTSGDSTTGELVFEVPEQKVNFDLAYQELYVNQEVGNTFFVSFAVK